MPQFDLPLDELRAYHGHSTEPEDFDAFWQKTLQETRAHELDVRFEPVVTGLSTVQVYDVTFRGFGGHPVRGWLRLPAGATEPLPLVVEFVGYGNGRGLAHEHLLWSSTGRAHFVMDTRGQGSAFGGGGATPDPVGSAPAYPGFMTRGIEEPETYYYRRVITDAVRAVEAARTHPLTDATRTVALGHSQGGGLSLAVGALVPDLVAVAPDTPFLCDFPRAIKMTDRHPYREIGLYLKTHRGRSAEVLRTLSYFDGVHFAARGRVPALFSTALEDQTCPPSTVFAAFNTWAHEDKTIEVYDFNDHEGGGPHHEAAKLRWLGSYA
ncbi:MULTISPECIES: acetylxylan esterase [Streptomyces]|uniref:Acetylxylan esterase n=1 Tax=Streptomyces spinosisporus TaxID=2927582 RepID=A0ABS9XA43_9ACTN|nr:MULTISPECIES: acetylxylan esterase [Streptomyces]MCI3238925.1 acetylxylan esterase [Streptomyces spinosisporus]WUB34697.1 acetylxylan esterase [Streptomyces sp. NBC_00588]